MDPQPEIVREAEYLVSWSIDVPASSPEEAARLAQSVMREQLNGTSFYAAVFEVRNEGAFHARDRDPVRVALNYNGDVAYEFEEGNVPS